MRFARIIEPFRFLRIQLAAWNAGVFLLVNLVMLVIVHEGVRRSLLAENDLRLLDDATEFSRALEATQPNLDLAFAEMDRKARTHRAEGLFLQLLGDDGHVEWSSDNTPPLEELRDVAYSPGEHASLGAYRLAQRSVTLADGRRYTVRVGASMQLVQDAVNRRTRLMTIFGLVIAVVTVGVGYWLAGRATRPLGKVVRTAARLRPSQLNERLPIRGTGDELDQLSWTINQFLDRIADYLSRNREFVSNAAHELRSPLAAIQSSIDVALNVDRRTEEYKDLLCDMSEECARLSTLVNQLLLLAEGDAADASMARERVRLDRVTAKSVDMFRGLAEDRGIQLNCLCGEEAVVEGDGDRLRQVVNNLLDNAIKFTQRGGKVDIEVHRQPDKGQVELRVRDTGVGVPPADLPHLFDRFFRGDKARCHAAGAPGHGLGLPICESIVHAHGGTINVSSEEGRGTLALVIFPSRESPPRHVEDEPAITART